MRPHLTFPDETCCSSFLKKFFCFWQNGSVVKKNRNKKRVRTEKKGAVNYGFNVWKRKYRQRIVCDRAWSLDIKMPQNVTNFVKKLPQKAEQKKHLLFFCRCRYRCCLLRIWEHSRFVNELLASGCLMLRPIHSPVINCHGLFSLKCPNVRYDVKKKVINAYLTKVSCLLNHDVIFWMLDLLGDKDRCNAKLYLFKMGSTHRGTTASRPKWLPRQILFRQWEASASLAFSLVKGNYAQENLFSSLAGETNMNQFDIEDQAFIFFAATYGALSTWWQHRVFFSFQTNVSVYKHSVCAFATHAVLAMPVVIACKVSEENFLIQNWEIYRAPGRDHCRWLCASEHALKAFLKGWCNYEYLGPWNQKCCCYSHCHHKLRLSIQSGSTSCGQLVTTR